VAQIDSSRLILETTNEEGKKKHSDREVIMDTNIWHTSPTLLGCSAASE